MKKMIACCVLLVMTLTLALTALGAGAQDAPQVETALLTGTLTEIADEYLLLEQENGVQIQVNLGQETVFTGADIAQLSLGQLLLVRYDGKMTRSLPAQIFALEVTDVVSLQGTITELEADYFLLETAEGRLFQVNFDETTHFEAEQEALLAVGTAVTVIYDGKTTRSIPAQLFALIVAQTQEQESQSLQGQIFQVEQDYFLIETTTHGQVQVNFSQDTVFEGTDASTLKVGQFIVVDFDGKMTISLPPQVFALKVVVYTLQGTIAQMDEGRMTLIQAETGEEVIVLLPKTQESFAAGDAVTVYTNGTMTLSLPAQTTAIGVVKGE